MEVEFRLRLQKILLLVPCQIIGLKPSLYVVRHELSRKDFGVAVYGWNDDLRIFLACMKMSSSIAPQVNFFFFLIESLGSPPTRTPQLSS